jgi:hypothetical protein
MQVEGTIPHLQGIEMYGNSIPVGTVAAIFLRHQFSQRYNIGARIQRACLRAFRVLINPGIAV